MNRVDELIMRLELPSDESELVQAAVAASAARRRLRYAIADEKRRRLRRRRFGWRGGSFSPA